MEGTFVGGPMTPLPVTPTKAATPMPTVDQHRTVADRPAAAPKAASTPVQSTANRSPIPYVIGIAVVLLILAGVFLVISNNNNATLIAQQTQTQVAVLALSATATNTNTPEASATTAGTSVPTNTSTLAASPTRRVAPTRTPNLTRTAFAQRANATASALAKATNTPRATATRQTVSNNGDTEDVIAELVESGHISTDEGGVILSADKIDLLIDKVDWSIWMPIEKRVDVFNFVASADITWDAPDENNECGFVLRYTPASQGEDNWTFYIVTIHREGAVKAWVRHEDGYEDEPIFDEETDAIDTDDRATNKLLVVAEGDKFHVFVNGELVGDFTDDSYESGRVEVFGTRFKESKGLVCRFRNVWVWQIE
jgi:hypothetical protein